MKRRRPHKPGPPSSAGRVEFVLYVSAASQASVRAVANVRRVLDRYKKGSIGLNICDVASNVAQADRDQIAFTPTLCRVAPEPTLRIIGDCSNTLPLVELLEFHGVRLKHVHR